MKKRLRKKKYLGEFQEFGFRTSFDMDPDLTTEQRNALIDDFIKEAIEDNGLQFGGGGPANNWAGFVTLDSRGSATEKHRELVRAWLESRPEVGNIVIRELRDAYHGWPELKEFS